jgi:hypothetical protein
MLHHSEASVLFPLKLLMSFRLWSWDTYKLNNIIRNRWMCPRFWNYHRVHSATSKFALVHITYVPSASPIPEHWKPLQINPSSPVDYFLQCWSQISTREKCYVYSFLSARYDSKLAYFSQILCPWWGLNGDRECSYASNCTAKVSSFNESKSEAAWTQKFLEALRTKSYSKWN